MHQLHGRTITPPPPHVATVHQMFQPSLGYAYWLRVDQLVHALLFVVISKDILNEVHDLTYSGNALAKVGDDAIISVADIGTSFPLDVVLLRSKMFFMFINFRINCFLLDICDGQQL